MGEKIRAMKKEEGRSWIDFPDAFCDTAMKAPSPVLASRHSTSNSEPVAFGFC